jgi:subtilisin family serine protease
VGGGFSVTSNEAFVAPPADVLDNSSAASFRPAREPGRPERGLTVMTALVRGSLVVGLTVSLLFGSAGAAGFSTPRPAALATTHRDAVAAKEILLVVAGETGKPRSFAAQPADDPEVKRALRTLRATSIRRVGGFRKLGRTAGKAIYSVRLAEGASLEEALLRAPESGRILAVEPNLVYEVSGPSGVAGGSATATVPNDPRYSEQWALPRIAAPAAWSVEPGDPSAVIGIIDTGVDYDHPDLAANIWVNAVEAGGTPGVDDDSNGFVDDVHGYDFVTANVADVAPGEDPGPPDADPMDVHGHGTHVSGIAAAVTDNATGIAGVSWSSRIMPLRAGYKAPSGNGVLLLSDIVDAIYYAIDNGADILSMSFGGGPSPSVAAALADARAAGVVLVAAAGNSGVEGPSYPAALPGVVAVAATDSLDAVPSWSNSGSWVDVCAPGLSILSTIANDTYTRLSGTSMSTPHVAGIAALILSHRPLLTAEQVATAIRSTCQTPASTRFVGLGRIDAERAVSYQGTVVARLDQKKSMQGLGPGAFQVLGTASGASYELSWGEGSYPASWTSVATGSTVIDGALATFDPSALPHNGDYCLRLVALDAAGQPGEDRWYFRYDGQLRAGWPREMSSSGPGRSVVVADLFGTGQKSIVACSLDGYVHVWDPSGTEAPGWPKKIVGTGGVIEASPACADLDGDGDLEIVLATVTEGIYAWRNDGTLMPGWPKTFPWPQRPFAAVSIGNLDADPGLEIVGSVLDPSALYAWNADGSLLPGWPRSFTGDWHVMATTALADVDHDGVDEIVFVPWTVPNGNQTAVYLISASGVDRPGWPVIIDGGTYSSPAVGDVDADGVQEIVVSTGTHLHLFDLQGQSKVGWPRDLFTSASQASPVIGALDLDAPLEVADVTICDWLWQFGHDGSLPHGWPVIQSNLCVISNTLQPSPVIADLDGDDRNELMIGKLDGGGLAAWTASGTMLAGWPKFVGSTGTSSTPVVADIDGDGDTEVLCPGNNGLLYVWNLGTPYGARADAWHSLHHDIKNTRCLDCPRSLLSVERPIATVGSLRIEAAYPSPSRGAVQLRFIQPSAARVALEVYDLTGRLVRRAWTGAFPAGPNSIWWDGRSTDGTPVATGIYMLRIVAGAERASTRVLVVR